MKFFQRWWKQPQDVLLRRMLFQIHLWAGLGVGLYIFVVCLTGGVLVYRNELYAYFTPLPTIVQATGNPLSTEELKSAARRAYPGWDVDDVRPGETPNNAVEIGVSLADDTKHRLFHPFTGQDLGDTMPAGFRFTVWMRDLHDNLLAGKTGRTVNGAGALLMVVLCITGAVLWWPGSRRWKQSAFVDLRSNWKRFNWSLHSVLGLWFFLFVLIWGISGAYLSLPDLSAQLFEYIEPYNENQTTERVVDQLSYWLAYLHFGRLGGRGIPYCGRGLCDDITKGVWALAALVPPVLFVTGAVMWWNRVLRPRVLRRSPVLSNQ